MIGEKVISKIEQRFPVRFWMKLTIEIMGEEVAVKSKNILSEYLVKYSLKDINPNYTKGRLAFDNWSDFAWVFFGGYLVLLFLDVPTEIRLIILSIGVVFFLLQLIKYEWVWFNTYDHKVLFPIRLSGDVVSKKKFVEQLVSQINKHKVS